MPQSPTITLRDLGYDEFFHTHTSSLETDAVIARVVAEHRESYTVKTISGEYSAKVTGKHVFSASKRADFPAVGDFVTLEILDAEKAVIRSILPRKTTLKKKRNDERDTQIIGTNIDTAFIIESLDRDYNLNRFERYVVLAREGHITPILILNKSDLVSEEELHNKIIEIEARFPGVAVLATSTRTETGLTALKAHINAGKTHCFLGSSGVGKSSLINTLLEGETIKTGAISESIGRGKHTTTAREMYFLKNGGIVIDNPGTRGVGVVSVDTGIEETFDEIISLGAECKFANCTHTHEPGCAVLKAIQEGTLDTAQHQNYLTLTKENEFAEMTDLEKRRKDKRFGKMIKKTLSELKELSE